MQDDTLFPAATTPPLALLQSYPGVDGGFDEMCAAPGRLRPHWEYLLHSLDNLGVAELSERSREIRRLLRDNGVTYTAYEGSQAEVRLWQLDPVPWPVPSQDWQRLERGLLQRAELLNLLLRDLYGPAETLKKNLLPPELVYSHPAFLRACVGVPPPGGRHLHLYAADLVRAADGDLYVVGDHPQSLSGVGYALENRVLLSRTFPSLFRDSQVHRLAMFFRSLRQTLQGLAWHNQDNSRIVVLTPGPHCETYFEHAYLAKYLGYTLVQPADLTVRDGKVWLKTLDGLQPVDVIMRWVGGDLCDPLELRPDSLLGVAGLLQAARLRNVALANPLGTDLVRSRGLLPFLPALARHFLGQDLLLPSPPTFWCGLPQQLDHVLANLHRLTLKTTLPVAGQAHLNGALLSQAQRARLRQQILAHPRQYVAQEELSRSSVPIFNGQGLEPRQMVLRTFLSSCDSGYLMMPGGLLRVSPETGKPLRSEQSGGLSKDVWVLASEPEKHLSLASPGNLQFKLPGGRGELPSRVAENLFWLGRYTERAESVVRLLRTVLLHLLNPPDYSEDKGGLHNLLRAVTVLTETYPGFVGDGAAARLAAPEAELMSVFLDRDRPGSLAFNLSALLFAARSVRDRISLDTWRVFNHIEESLNVLQQQHQAVAHDDDALNDALEQLNELVLAFAAFSGLLVENMTHGHGWRFLVVGRRLERAQLSAHLLRASLSHGVVNEALLLEQLLTVCDSLMTYRSRYRSQLQLEAVLDLLLQDETNPRSLSYQLERLQHFIGELPRDQVFAYKSPEERLALESLTLLRLADPRVLMGRDENGLRPQLDQLLGRLSQLLPALSDALSKSYFSHAQPARQLGEAEGESAT